MSNSGKSPKFQISSHETIPVDIQAQVLKMRAVCFPWSVGENKSQEHADKFCSQADVIRVIVACEGPRVIGAAKALKRRINFHGKEITLGGVGGVGTHPDKRQQGVARAMMDAAMTELKRARADIAYLCTNFDIPWLVSFYESHGFTPLHKQQTFLGKSGKRYTEWDGMIAPICSSTVVEQILKSPEPFDIGVGNW